MLTLKKIHKSFNPGTINEVRALDGVDLHIEEGSFVIVLGMNGSGKSTLLNAIAGSFQVDGGSLTLDERNITDWPEHKRAALIGRVFQNPFSGTAPNLSIAENFAMAAKRGHRRGLWWALTNSLKRELHDRVSRLNMGLEDRLNGMIGTLSGGQRQALTLLMATWNRPKLLLLDEHTAALDPKSASQVIHLTREVVDGGRLTTFMVTHSMQQAVSMGDRLIMMHHGRIVHDFSGEDKQRLKVEDLLQLFNGLRRGEEIRECLPDC
jgi:putative ABC transport system ATP-binding protein